MHSQQQQESLVCLEWSLIVLERYAFDSQLLAFVYSQAFYYHLWIVSGQHDTGDY